MRSCCKFTPAGRATFLVFCVFLSSCIHVQALYGEQPLIHMQQQQHPLTSTFSRNLLLPHLSATSALHIFFLSRALGFDPLYAIFRHYPPPLVALLIDGLDKPCLVCYLILTSHVHFFMQSHLGKPRLDPSSLANCPFGILCLKYCHEKPHTLFSIM